MTLVSFTGVSVSTDGRRLVEDVAWTLGADENWVVTGPNGSGKTTLLRLIRGDLWPHPASRGRRVYTIDGETTESPIPIRRIASFITPEIQEAYRRHEWDITGRDAICTGFADTVWLFGRVKPGQQSRVDGIAAKLGINHLLDKSVLAMSSGERRKVLLARALVKQPRLLLLDEIFENLDEASRINLHGVLDQLMAAGVQIVLTTHRADDLSPRFTHHARMEAGRIIHAGPLIDGGNFFPADSGRTPISNAPSIDWAPFRPSSEDTVSVFALSACNVYLDRVKVLHDLDWCMRDEENWAFLGANGSGKSTLIRLLTGEEYPAHGGRIDRFGQSEPMDIWEIRRCLGLLSSDLQERYDREITAREVVLSGFRWSIGVLHEYSSDERAAAETLLKQLGLDHLADRVYTMLSFGERRKVLLARAIVHRPRVLILDEPLNGLDAPSRRTLVLMLEALSRAGVRLIYVTHHREEIPSTVTHAAILADGRIQAKGPVAEILSRFAV